MYLQNTYIDNANLGSKKLTSFRKTAKIEKLNNLFGEIKDYCKFVDVIKCQEQLHKIYKQGFFCAENIRLSNPILIAPLVGLVSCSWQNGGDSLSILYNNLKSEHMPRTTPQVINENNSIVNTINTSKDLLQEEKPTLLEIQQAILNKQFETHFNAVEVYREGVYINKEFQVNVKDIVFEFDVHFDLFDGCFIYFKKAFNESNQELEYEIKNQYIIESYLESFLTQEIS